MNNANSVWSPSWNQFLVAKRRILSEYSRAKSHSEELHVQTHHGVVAEAAVRGWLSSFLPKKYGVTSGYIRAQALESAAHPEHFDVIIYDQLESPILWIEDNVDKSELGRARFIPAEHVCGVLEVKASFSRTTVRQACAKLRNLEPLMAGMDAPNERYPTYLRRNVFLASIFVEL